MIHTHETAAMSLGVPRHIVEAIRADPHKVDWPGLLRTFGPVVLQVLLGLAGGNAGLTTPAP